MLRVSVMLTLFYAKKGTYAMLPSWPDTLKGVMCLRTEQVNILGYGQFERIVVRLAFFAF